MLCRAVSSSVANTFPGELRGIVPSRGTYDFVLLVYFFCSLLLKRTSVQRANTSSGEHDSTPRHFRALSPYRLQSESAANKMKACEKAKTKQSVPSCHVRECDSQKEGGGGTRSVQATSPAHFFVCCCHRSGRKMGKSHGKHLWQEDAGEHRRRWAECMYGQLVRSAQHGVKPKQKQSSGRNGNGRESQFYGANRDIKTGKDEHAEAEKKSEKEEAEATLEVVDGEQREPRQTPRQQLYWRQQHQRK